MPTSRVVVEKKGTIGSRLKSQREKLGLSQAEFSGKAGVTARSQRNYEAGTRVPDAEYLIAVSKIGVDLVRVLHGGYEDHGELTDEVSFVLALEQSFGISRDDLAHAINTALVDDDIGAYDPELLFSEIKRASPVFQALIERESGLVASLLTDVLVGVDAVLRKKRLDMASFKKAQAVVMLYRSFKSSGKIDPAMIEEAVNLAST